MYKKYDFQDFQFPELPDNREKVDFQFVNPGQMENAADILQHRERNSFRADSVYDLRKSLAWDSAFFDSPGVLEPEELFETLNIQVANNGFNTNGQRGPQSKESSRTNGTADMRVSLAWDSAFFTSPGVLDAEELSIINGGCKRPSSLLLPGVEEEIWRSVESNSTVNSEGCSLASLEIDLFDDIRASVRKAHDVSSSEAITGKLEREKGRPKGCASKKLDSTSQIQTAGSSRKSTPPSGRPPKISGRANSSPIVPSERPIQLQMDNKTTKSVTGKRMPLLKKICLRESCNISKLSMKSPSSVLPAARNKHAVSTYASADFTGKARSNPRKRIDSQMAASVSSFRTPSKYSTRKNTELMNSSDPVCLFSTPKSSPYTSPSSSMDAWSSAPSATSLKQRSNNSVIDASKISDSARHHHVKPCPRHEIREIKFFNPQTNDISTFTSPAPTNVSTKLKPSGLRVPSPKIGYFDAGKSVGSAQNGGLKFQSSLQGTFPKTGSGTNGSANRPISVNNRLAGSLNGSGSKLGLKICSREKKQPLKEHLYNKANQLGEHNKENISSLGNDVDYLSQRMGALNFTEDFVTPVQRK